MPVTFNPAGSLTANRIPYATGDGRLADSAGLAVNNGRVHVLTGLGDQYQIRLGYDSSAYWDIGRESQFTGYFRIASQVGELLRAAPAGEVLFGTTSNSINGRLQLSSHSALTGGLAFGTSATGSETIWRHSAGVLRTDGQWQIGATNPAPMQWQSGITALRLGDRCSVESALVNALGTVIVRSSSRPSYGLPTGTTTRTTFDPATVTLSQLAERVAAIIHDLSASNGTYHGLFA